MDLFNEILKYSAQGKRPAVQDFLGKLEPVAEIFTTTKEYKLSCTMDLTWAMARLSTVKLLKEEIHSRYGTARAEAPRGLPAIYRRRAISCSSQPFATVWTDMALEQLINLDSKYKGGIVGISLNADALQRWFLN